MEIDYIVDTIINRLNRIGIHTKIIKSNKSSSVYIKINHHTTIRVSDHYKPNDSKNKYNIGTHIKKFMRIKNSYYYQHNRVNNLIIKLIKDIKDNKKEEIINGSL